MTKIHDWGDAQELTKPYDEGSEGLRAYDRIIDLPDGAAILQTIIVGQGMPTVTQVPLAPGAAKALEGAISTIFDKIMERDRQLEELNSSTKEQDELLAKLLDMGASEGIISEFIKNMSKEKATKDKARTVSKIADIALALGPILHDIIPRKRTMDRPVNACREHGPMQDPAASRGYRANPDMIQEISRRAVATVGDVPMIIMPVRQGSQHSYSKPQLEQLLSMAKGLGFNATGCIMISPVGVQGLVPKETPDELDAHAPECDDK